MKTFAKTICALIVMMFSYTAYADSAPATKQGRTGSLEPVNAALRTNYGQVVSAAQVRSGIASKGVVRTAVSVPDEAVKAETIIIRRGPAVKLMNP